MGRVRLRPETSAASSVPTAIVGRPSHVIRCDKLTAKLQGYVEHIPSRRFHFVREALLRCCGRRLLSLTDFYF